MKQTVKITKGGRLVIPVSIRKSLHLVDGSSVMLDLEAGGGFTVIPVRESIRRAQERCRPYLSGPGLLSEELIQEPGSGGGPAASPWNKGSRAAPPLAHHVRLQIRVSNSGKATRRADSVTSLEIRAVSASGSRSWGLPFRPVAARVSASPSLATRNSVEQFRQ